jgi:hypothetical protein
MEWRPVTWTAVGGIVAVGIPDERRVVVGSHSGVEVFDATTGERLARVSSDGYAWLTRIGWPSGSPAQEATWS